MQQKVNNSTSLHSLNAFEFLPITQSAAIAAFTLRGRCDKNAGDACAVEAMRNAFNAIPYKGKVVVGEGEKDEAPMLYIGEEVGQGSCTQYDIVVDPLEGTRLLAENKPNALSVLGILPPNILSFPKESYYMEKIVAPTEVMNSIDIEAPISVIVEHSAHILGKSIKEMTLFVLDKPRHSAVIKEILATGARVQLHTDGDVAGSLFAIAQESSIDMMYGIGGTPEGMLTAVAIKASGKGQLYARFAPQSTKEHNALLEKNIDLHSWFTADTLIPTNDVFFLATGVTNGQLLRGVEHRDNAYYTHSLLMQGRDKRICYVEETLSIENV